MSDTPTTNIDPAELRRLALAATPGPWRAFLADASEENPFGRREAVVSHRQNDAGNALGRFVLWTGDDGGNADALFISALHPQAVLALLDRLEQAEADRDNLRRLLGLLYCAREDVDMETWREVKAALEGK